MWTGSSPDEIESATLTPAAPIQCAMGFTLILIVYGLPGLLVGYRGYMSGKRFPWLKHGWVTLVVIAVCIYVGWGLLDTLLRNVFGLGKGFGVDAWTVMMFCCLLPAISGFCLWFGYMVAVIHRSYRDKDWSRLNDLWRRT